MKIDALLCLGLITAALPFEAGALPYDVQARGYVEAFPGLDNSDTWIAGSNTGTGLLMQPSYGYSLSLTANSDQGTQNAGSSGTVAPGSIAFSSTASSRGNGGNGADSIALDWSDTVTLVSALPAGTPVTLRYTLVVDGSLAVNGDHNAAAHIQDPGSADVVIGLTPGIAGVQPLVLEAGILDGNLFGSASVFPGGRYALVGQAGSGSSFSFSVDLESFVNASSSDASPSPDSFAQGSIRLYVDTLTPGVTLVSASGVSYASPAPGPAAWAMLLPGLGLLAAAARRRTRR